MWLEVIDSSIAYLASLKTIDGVPLIQTRRKTFVQGFIIAAKSAKLLALSLFTLQSHPFSYVLTYKLSQDHLELTFSCLRGMNGYCSNPTVIQVVSGLKRILLRTSIVASKNGNCVHFEVDESPSIFSLKWTKNRCDVAENSVVEDVDDDMLALDMTGEHSLYKKNTLAYIGGYICRALRANITCETCCDALFSEEKSDLIRDNDNGPLIYPSSDVLSVLYVSENVFKQFCIICIEPASSKNLRSKMKIRVLQELFDTNTFSSLHQHDIENHDPLEDMHSTQLCKQIAHKHFDMRLFRYQQQYTDDVIHKGKIGTRQKLNKSLIFSGL